MMLVKRNTAYRLDESQRDQMAVKFNLPKKFIELLFSRGFDSAEKIDLFLNGNQSKFHDPYLLKGMTQAATRVKRAIQNKETIVIFSDYDADGICAASILSLYLKKVGVDAYAHIPDRVSEGYGLNITSLEQIIEQINPDLIITCDCGISCVKEVEYTLDLGVDIIVTDHHSPAEIIPECVVVNPMMSDCPYPDKTLCGAGVALKLVQALSSIEESLEFTDIAAIATVADLVPLTGESRLITQLGLKTLASRKNLGLSRLMDFIKIENPTSSDITFKIAPRINAAGRMGDASRAFDLICATDIAVADKIIKEIDADNEKRKAVCEKIYQQASTALINQKIDNKKCVILHNKDWEKGVIGIVAAKLSGEYKRPAIIMASSGDCYKGTARSIKGINMYEALSKNADVFVEFGGHSQAAGFTVRADKVEELKERMESYFATFDDELFVPRAQYDIEITENDINPQFVSALELLEPFGHGNQLPLFKLSLSEIRFNPCKTNAQHTQITTPTGIHIYAYNNRNKNQFLLGDSNKHLIVELQKSQNTSYSPVLVVAREIVCDKLDIDDDYACANFIKSLNFKSKTPNPRIKTYQTLELEQICKGVFGTLVIAGCKETFKKALALPFSKHIVIKEFVNSTTKNNFNRLVVSPEFDGDLPFWGYNKIVFLDTPPDQLISFLAKFDAEIFVPKTPNFAPYNKVDLSRQAFAKYFELIRQNKIKSASLNEYVERLKQTNQLTLTQFMVCLTVFIELSIVRLNPKSGFCPEIDPTVRSPLNSSKIYNYLLEIEEIIHGKA